MVSLLDIPSHLLFPHQKAAFSLWVGQQPVPHDVKRKLIYKWISKTRTPFYVTDYQIAGLNPNPVRRL